MEKQELLKKIEMVVKRQTLPAAVKEAVSNSYIEYQDVYRGVLSKVERAIGNDQKHITELNHIASYMKKDYEEDCEMSSEMEKTSYAIKIDTMLENIMSEINTILHSEERGQNTQRLEAIIDVEELTEEEKAIRDKQEKEESIRRSAKTPARNMYCAKEIVGSVIAEIESSRDTLVMKLQNAMKDAPNSDYIKIIQARFKEEIEVVNKRAKETLTTQIKEALDDQDNQIAEEIITIYNQYKEIDRPLSQRDKFASALQVKVNPEKAIQKVQEANEQKEPAEREGSLPPILE